MMTDPLQADLDASCNPAFSIDSDDEDDLLPRTDVAAAPPLAPPWTSTTPKSPFPEVAESLPSTTSTSFTNPVMTTAYPTSTTNYYAGAPGAPPSSTAPPATYSAPYVATAEHGSSPIHHANHSGSIGGNTPAAALTSRLASNLTSMAQRGLAHVGVSPLQVSATTTASPRMMMPAGASFDATNIATTAPPPAMELDKEQKQALLKTHVGDLLQGEAVIMFLANLLYVSTGNFQYAYQQEPHTTWCCVMTYYRVIFFGTHPTRTPARPYDWNPSCWPQETTQLISMPLASIEKIEKAVFSAGSSTNMGLTLYGKDSRILRFTTNNYQETQRAYESLHTYAFPGRKNVGYLFAFESKREKVMESIVETESGHKEVTVDPVPKRFDAVVEYERQFRNNNQYNPWCIYTTMNAQYQLCGSYPNVLVGPAAVDDRQPDGQRLLQQCAMFRSEQRLPSLTWASGIDGASIWRSSQPKVGFQGNRSSADELYLKHIMEAAAAANRLNEQPALVLSRSMLMQLTGMSDSLQAWLPETGCGCKILDLRPRSAAVANRTQGYGYENTSNYPGTTLQFCNIGNIHAVRDAHQKLSSLCLSSSTSDVNWNALVEDTKWLQLIRLILAAAWETAYWVHVHRLPVLLHCSHGWDRTSQVSALAQLLLDPYYRTIKGFATLIEKDFSSFGHPFHLRCGHGEGRGNESAASNNGSNQGEGQVSPIFLQFVDCAYQLVNLYPECFEYNTTYLLVLSDHIYSCRFGNFLCDTERDREQVAKIRQRTDSIWDYLETRDDIRNPSYSEQYARGVLLMPLSTLMRNISLWTDRHCRYGPKPTHRWLPVDRNDDSSESIITKNDIQASLTALASVAGVNQSMEKLSLES